MEKYIICSCYDYPSEKLQRDYIIFPSNAKERDIVIFCGRIHDAFVRDIVSDDISWVVGEDYNEDDFEEMVDKVYEDCEMKWTYAKKEDIPESAVWMTLEEYKTTYNIY